MTKQQIEANVDAVLTTADNQNDPVKQFCTVYQGTVRPILELIKNFTGPKVDKQIDELEHAADLVCSGTHPDVANFCKVWNNFHLKGLLKFIQVFTGAKVDKAINRFIEIADTLCP